jgi:hypothetical protein
MVKTKWRPFCFNHLKTGPNIFLTSLDRFGMNKIFFMTLISKTVYASNRTFLSGFQMVLFSDARDWQKIESEYRPRFVIRSLFMSRESVLNMSGTVFRSWKLLYNRTQNNSVFKWFRFSRTIFLDVLCTRHTKTGNI